MQLLSCPFSILVTEDRNQPAVPPGDPLVSKPVTKPNGQPNLPVFTGYRVSQATEIYCGQKLLVTEKRVVHSQTSLHHVRSGVSHHTNDIVYMPHLQGGWPGAKSLLNVKSCVNPTALDHSNNRTVNCFHCHQTSVQRDRKCLSDYQMSQMWHTVCL